MNSLYIGPYRQVDNLGILSRLYLQDFASISSKMMSRPVYLNMHPKFLGGQLDSENNIENLDTIIQNLPIDMLVSDYKKTNIAIPIISNKRFSPKDIAKLNKFNYVLVDDPCAYEELSSNLNVNVFFIKPNISYEKIKLAAGNKRFNLGIHNHYKKVYLVADYSSNVDLIDTIILQFSSLLSKHRNLSLVLFLSGIDQQTSSLLESKIRTIYEKFSLRTDTMHIIMIASELDEESHVVAHNTGDIFLNLNDFPRNSLNFYLAEALNKPVLDLSDIDKCVINYRNNTYSEDGINIADPCSLSHYMARAISNNSHTENFKSQYIKDIIK